MSLKAKQNKKESKPPPSKKWFEKRKKEGPITRILNQPIIKNIQRLPGRQSLVRMQLDCIGMPNKDILHTDVAGLLSKSFGCKPLSLTEIVRIREKFVYGQDRNHRIFAHGALGEPWPPKVAKTKTPEPIKIPKPIKVKPDSLSIPYLEKEWQSNVEIFQRNIAFITQEPGDHVNNGVECVYLPVDGKRALKLYTYSKDARTALSSQAEASAFKIGPDVLSGLLEIIFPLGSDAKAGYVIRRFFKKGIAWGYYTAKADTMKVADMRMHNIDRYMDDKKALKTRIFRANMSFPINDLHDNNTAYIGDLLVAIDFGWHTTEKQTRSEIDRRILDSL